MRSRHTAQKWATAAYLHAVAQTHQYDSEIYEQKSEERENLASTAHSLSLAALLYRVNLSRSCTYNASVNQLADWNFAPEFWPASLLNALGILCQSDIGLILR